ncbi:PilN domain-containing protein [Crocosphaera sp. XPORK-15E]|uniref:PilN domain-containing protein n=1 Tax=Crocosphaera sp. XPORK-15E TaxID=3110247 RepID=UPI002B21362A|nr:PilN domain-containing protein [Crocosphaera sp. XPORK-15E]MEA5537317.1 PilN domain-containing protein [Crocosphaera sp. XPORK-15E]
MYSLDINFLKDRHLDSGAKTTTLVKGKGPSLQEQLPIFIGGGIMLLLPALTATSLLVFNQLSSQTQENIQQLEGELGKLNAQNKSIEEIEAKVKQNDQEIKSLVQVFDQIRPWSAILQQIKTQIPANVQLTSIKQEEANLTITGFALDYNDLNDFLLTLQSSPLLQADQTVIKEASLSEIPVSAQNASKDLKIEIPQGVKYTLSTVITDRPSSELKRQFEADGAVGLVNRIKTLENKGVLKP